MKERRAGKRPLHPQGSPDSSQHRLLHTLKLGEIRLHQILPLRRAKKIQPERDRDKRSDAKASKRR